MLHQDPTSVAAAQDADRVAIAAGAVVFLWVFIVGSAATLLHEWYFDATDLGVALAASAFAAGAVGGIAAFYVSVIRSRQPADAVARRMRRHRAVLRATVFAALSGMPAGLVGGAAFFIDQVSKPCDGQLCATIVLIAPLFGLVAFAVVGLVVLVTTLIPIFVAHRSRA